MKKKKSIKSRLKTTIYIVLLLFPCMELALRIMGGKPYIQEDYKISITPSNAYAGHDSLGIQLNPGEYKIVLNDSVKFTATKRC
mgnify:FL=1